MRSRRITIDKLWGQSVLQADDATDQIQPEATVQASADGYIIRAQTSRKQIITKKDVKQKKSRKQRNRNGDLGLNTVSDLNRAQNFLTQQKEVADKME